MACRESQGSHISMASPTPRAAPGTWPQGQSFSRWQRRGQGLWLPESARPSTPRSIPRPSPHAAACLLPLTPPTISCLTATVLNPGSPQTEFGQLQKLGGQDQDTLPNSWTHPPPHVILFLSQEAASPHCSPWADGSPGKTRPVLSSSSLHSPLTWWQRDSE